MVPAVQNRFLFHFILYSSNSSIFLFDSFPKTECLKFMFPLQPNPKTILLPPIMNIRNIQNLCSSVSVLVLLCSLYLYKMTTVNNLVNTPYVCLVNMQVCTIQKTAVVFIIILHWVHCNLIAFALNVCAWCLLSNHVISSTNNTFLTL